MFFQEKAIFCQYVREMSEKSQGKSKFEIGRHPDSRQQCIDCYIGGFISHNNKKLPELNVFHGDLVLNPSYINPFLVIFLVIYLCYFGHILVIFLSHKKLNWICRSFFGHILVLFWSYIGHILGVQKVIFWKISLAALNPQDPQYF